MHRIVSIPGEEPFEGVSLIEQDSAPILFLTSAFTDIATLAAVIDKSQESKTPKHFRAIPLDSLTHPAQIDHYLTTTCSEARVIVVRLLGGRGHWQYGLDQLTLWRDQNKSRKLIVLSGTKENELELHSLSNVSTRIINILSELLRIGGILNIETFVRILLDIYYQNDYLNNSYSIERIEDPYIEEDRSYPDRIVIILYRSLLNSGDTSLAAALKKSFINKGLSPTIIWVTSLQKVNIKNQILSYLRINNIKLIITGTSFASVDTINQKDDQVLWDETDIPVIQLITSSRSLDDWSKSSQGINPRDLSLQVVLPEIDGRITTRPCAFRSLKLVHDQLKTSIYRLEPYQPSIDWLVEYSYNHIKLSSTPREEIKIAIIVANYPVRNGRLANGVGLDTPASAANIISLLKEEGYYLGSNNIPGNGNQLIQKLIAGRTNDPESIDKEPLDYLSLDEYKILWTNLSESIKKSISERWDIPEQSCDLEKSGYAIHGSIYGNIAILIQPSRGYETNNYDDIHSPDLPPPHRYLAQYHWIKNNFRANAIIHLGKHGTLEWLPGKSVGLSNKCFPHIIIDTLPNIYPFIVNDPGEGSQAKRRSQALIIDHLTPPLTRSGTHGKLLEMESLIEEYYECNLLSKNRSKFIQEKIMNLVEESKLSGIIEKVLTDTPNQLDQEYIISKLDSYLCELKDSQIRTGLHIIGTPPNPDILKQLFFSIIKAPTEQHLGITQLVAEYLNIEMDPWSTPQVQPVSKKDLDLVNNHSKSIIYSKTNLIDWIDNQSYLLIQTIIDNNFVFPVKTLNSQLAKPLQDFLMNIDNDNSYVNYIFRIWLDLQRSTGQETKSIIRALNGKRVQSGPSGAPTRGRPEVLPTGRNFYSVDLRGIPTESAWELGTRSAEEILSLHLLDHGEHLRSLALSVWGTATMRNGGEEVCQLFSLIGIRPVWDGPTRRIIELEVIPLNQLNRPRVDVTLRISGLFRDAFPQLIGLVNKAQSIILNLDEPKELNPYASYVKKGGSKSRVFGSAPGAYGAGLQALLDSGDWESKDQLAEAYLSWSKWEYNGQGEPIPNKKQLEEVLSNVQVVLHSQDNREHDIFDSDDYYQFHGGLTAAVEKTSGIKPDTLFADHSRRENLKIHSLYQEMDKVIRSRVLNPKWIEGIKKHGYKGAFEMNATLDYIFAYDATTDQVPKWTYSCLVNDWLRNKNTYDFLLENNPWALRDIAEKLLEAKNRGIWENASTSDISLLKKIVLSTEAHIESENYL